MAKKITLLSKLSRDRKEYVTDLLKDTDIKTIEVNSKKGIIVKFDEDEDEYFIILDNLSKHSDDDEDDDEDDFDDEDDDADMNENELELES